MLGRGTRILMLSLACAMSAQAQQPRASSVVPPVAPSAGLTRFRESEGFAQFSGLTDSARVVIRDGSEWSRYWALINRPFIPQPPEPAVDFSREAVVVASLGSRPTGGFTIRIDQATTDAERLIISVVRTLPGAGCALAAVVTQPVDVVRIPTPTLPIAFTERVERTDCQADQAPRRPGGI
jgi:hypothetical protein